MRALVLLVSLFAAVPAWADDTIVPVGSIRGAVSWKGKAPARAALRRDSDPVCAATEQLDPAIVVTRGKLAGVLVRLKNGSGGTWPVPSAPAVLKQEACAYQPRVLGVLAGQALAVDNGDPTYHNVRGTRGDATVFNLSQPAGAPRIVRTDVGPVGSVLHLRCDVHPWMEAFVVVHDHPYFAVTGEDGAFELRAVPPGSYVLEAWHPTLGLRTAKVKVKAGKVAKAKVTYRAPK